MKFYSEKLDQMFDSMEELIKAETPKKKRAKKDIPVQEVENPVDQDTKEPTRKELAAAVEQADEKVHAAYADYETAKIKVEELSKKYLEEFNAIIEPAKSAIKNAERERYDAIRRFNDSFGAYQVTFTGAKAAEELVKAMNNIDGRISKLFSNSFWF